MLFFALPFFRGCLFSLANILTHHRRGQPILQFSASLCAYARFLVFFVHLLFEHLQVRGNFPCLRLFFKLFLVFFSLRRLGVLKRHPLTLDVKSLETKEPNKFPRRRRWSEARSHFFIIHFCRFVSFFSRDFANFCEKARNKSLFFPSGFFIYFSSSWVDLPHFYLTVYLLPSLLHRARFPTNLPPPPRRTGEQESQRSKVDIFGVVSGAAS